MNRRAVQSILAVLIFVGGLAASPSTLETREKQAQGEPPGQSGGRVPVNLHSNYAEVLALLKDLSARFGKARLNTFYVSPVARDGGAESAYIYWKQDNSILILALPVTNPVEEKSAFWLYTGKTRIDLAKNVAASEDEVGSSTFLVSKAWADGIIKDCVSEGRKITIPRRAAKRKARPGSALE